MSRCAVAGCRLQADEVGMFCEAHTAELIGVAGERMEDVLAIASTVYLGRTGFPERRLLEHQRDHGRDHLMVMHWAASWPEAEVFESAIINRFDHLARLQNATKESVGRHGSPWNAVYVSFGLKRGVQGLPSAMDVAELHWRMRVWPDPMIPAKPVLLRTRLTSAAAGLVLEAWNPRLTRASRPAGDSVRAEPAAGSPPRRSRG